MPHESIPSNRVITNESAFYKMISARFAAFITSVAVVTNWLSTKIIIILRLKIIFG